MLGPLVPSSRSASSAEKAAGRSICRGLLWPGSDAAQSRCGSAVPAALAAALRRRRADILAFRCFLLLLRSKDSSAKDAYTSVLLRLKVAGFLLRDVALLEETRLLVLLQPLKALSLAELVELVKGLDSIELAVQLQPHFPIRSFPEDEDTRQLCIHHWCQSHLDCSRFFPYFFQAHSRLLVVPSLTAEEVERLCQQLLLHGFAVLAIAHPVTEKLPKSDAALAVRGFGLVPAIEDGEASGSACSLNFPPGSKLLRSVAAAVETKALPPALSAVLGPPAAKPKAIAPTVIKKTGAPAPLVAIPPLPAARPGAAPVSYAPLLPPPPARPASRASPPEPPKSEEVVLTSREEDWMEFRDLRTAKAYYYNPVSKESCWQRPKLKPPGAPSAPPKLSEMNHATGLIPGAKDPEEEGKVAVKTETKAVAPAPAPMRVHLASDEPELSALIIFSDASSLGITDVAREFLKNSGCPILLDRGLQVTEKQWRLLMGLSHQDVLEQSLQNWFSYLQGQCHWLLLVRRSAAVSMLQQLCFGPSIRGSQRATASYGPLVKKWPFLQVEEGLRPWPTPMFLSLQALLQLPEAAASPACPLAATACHSRIHAAAFLSEAAPELLQSQEVVLVAPASINQPDFDSLKAILSSKPMGYTELLSQADVVSSELVEAGSRGFPFALLHRGLGWTNWKSEHQCLTRVALFTRQAAQFEAQAFGELFGRLDIGVAAADDGCVCALQQAYNSILQKGAVMVWRPFDVDRLIAGVWPEHAAPRGSVSLPLADRCLRLAEPRLGISEACGLAPSRRLRNLASWPKDLVQEISHATGSELSIAGRRILVRAQTAKQISAVSCTQRALRWMACMELCRVGEDFRHALIQFPRDAVPEEPLWATVALRNSVPWRPLARHPDVYRAETQLLPVKLNADELKLLKLEGRVVTEDIAQKKVQKGWRLCSGGDLPRGRSALAADPLGVPRVEASDSVAEALAQLAASTASDAKATLIFERVKEEPKVLVPQHRALTADLCAKARGESMPELIEVPRREHMPAEALLLGTSLARLAISKEVPIQPNEVSDALQRAAEALEGSAHMVERCAGKTDWLWEPGPRSSHRSLCNEAVNDVVDAWRSLSAEETITNDGEYFTDQFLSLSFYGDVIATAKATCFSIEGPLLARNVLVSFGQDSSWRFWECFPVLAKPGRFAAQLWAMLSLDDSLKSFGEARGALREAFFRCYCQEASGAGEQAELRLRLHLVLVLLELIWLRRQSARGKESYPELPGEAGLREALREEVLQAATFWKRVQKARQAKLEKSEK